MDNTVFGGIFLFDLDKFWQFFNAEMKKATALLPITLGLKILNLFPLTKRQKK